MNKANALLLILSASITSCSAADTYDIAIQFEGKPNLALNFQLASLDKANIAAADETWGVEKLISEVSMRIQKLDDFKKLTMSKMSAATSKKKVDLLNKKLEVDKKIQKKTLKQLGLVPDSDGSDAPIVTVYV